MQKRWWLNIRWRMIFGSVLLALLATSLLALAAIIAIIQFYSADQKDQVQGYATNTARSISENIDLKNKVYLAQAASIVLPDTQMQQYLVVVIAKSGKIAYPPYVRGVKQDSFAKAILRLFDPSVKPEQLSKIVNAVNLGLAGTAIVDQMDRTGPINVPQPFAVEPVTTTVGGVNTVLGVLFVIPRLAAQNTFPPFIASVGVTVAIASVAVTIIAALAAILFSRTITRPLVKLTKAAGNVASGKYNTQVQIDGPGELGELAHSFNEMAQQLSRDVEELHKQELWRRELIMSITHDLATPLTAIAGLGESLVDGVNQDREDYEATGRIIVRETLRLRRLVKDLHMMAKVEAGALYPQRKPVRLASLVDEELAVLISEFERARVEPRNAIPYNLPLVQADPDMLTRVFANLCDNALRHTPPGGTVTIESQLRPDAIAISVVDTGDGIPPEALPRIFERFYRADSARQSATGGSGLGLAIVRAIIEAHGGKVWAENMPKAGARIAFTIPLQPAGQPSFVDASTLPLGRRKQAKRTP